jgi:hypothetical protein
VVGRKDGPISTTDPGCAQQRFNSAGNISNSMQLKLGLADDLSSCKHALLIFQQLFKAQLEYDISRVFKICNIEHQRYRTGTAHC